MQIFTLDFDYRYTRTSNLPRPLKWTAGATRPFFESELLHFLCWADIYLFGGRRPMIKLTLLTGKCSCWDALGDNDDDNDGQRNGTRGRLRGRGQGVRRQINLAELDLQSSTGDDEVGERSTFVWKGLKDRRQNQKEAVNWRCRCVPKSSWWGKRAISGTWLQ